MRRIQLDGISSTPNRRQVCNSLRITVTGHIAVPHPQVILIVEDDGPLRLMWRTGLRLEGFDVVEAGDGLDALKLVEASPPDLVLLDLGLPHVDGVSVRRDLATQFFSRNIPIVVVTGSSADLAYLDVDCVLRKPVSVDQVLRAVHHCIRSTVPSLGT
jgi:CheY-like chemotaxis protein